MKKLIFTLTCAFALLFTSNLSAQMSVGGRVGVNFANINNDQDGISFDTDAITGLQIAGILDIGLSNNFSIQPELNFIQKGFKIELDFGGYSASTKFNLNYLEAPIHAKYKFGTETLKFFALAGPSIGFAMSGKTENCESGICQTEDFEFNDDDGFQRIEIGLSMGAGVGFNAGPGQLFLDLRYLLGLSNLNEDSDDGKIHNRGFAIGLGYMIPLGN